MVARSAPEQDERGAQLAALRALLKEKRRRLEQRQLQAARYGVSVDPVITLEIEDLKLDIADLERQAQEIEGQLVISTAIPGRGAISQRHEQRAKAHIFISYKRNTIPDEPLALRLHSAFKQACHSVFIEQRIKVGVEWAREIQRQVEACDWMLVLLSDASVHSEMVAKEVEYAHKYNQRTGKARLLPVRVGYAEALPYQLSHYLDRLQYAKWSDDADDKQVIQQLLDAIDDIESLAAPAPTVTSPATRRTGEPRPYADPRFVESLRDPSGGVRLRSEFYIERD